MRAVDGAAQGLRPEARRLVYVIDVAVNQHGAEAGVVHAGFLDLHRTLTICAPGA